MECRPEATTVEPIEEPAGLECIRYQLQPTKENAVEKHDLSNW